MAGIEKLLKTHLQAHLRCQRLFTARYSRIADTFGMVSNAPCPDRHQSTVFSA